MCFIFKMWLYYSLIDASSYDQAHKCLPCKFLYILILIGLNEMTSNPDIFDRFSFAANCSLLFRKRNSFPVSNIVLALSSESWYD